MGFDIGGITGSEMWSVWEIGGLAYEPCLPESLECFQAKLDAFPEGCLACRSNGSISGYILSHPWLGDCVPLDFVMGEIPENPDCYYIHDLSVLPQFRGIGIGRALANAALEVVVGNRLTEARLISVQDSHPFWERMGFETVSETTYGPDEKGRMGPAKHMRRML